MGSKESKKEKTMKKTFAMIVLGIGLSFGGEAVQGSKLTGWISYKNPAYPTILSIDIESDRSTRKESDLMQVIYAYVNKGNGTCTVEVPGVRLLNPIHLHYQPNKETWPGSPTSEKAHLVQEGWHYISVAGSHITLWSNDLKDLFEAGDVVVTCGKVSFTLLPKAEDDKWQNLRDGQFSPYLEPAGTQFMTHRDSGSLVLKIDGVERL